MHAGSASVAMKCLCVRALLPCRARPFRPHLGGMCRKWTPRPQTLARRGGSPAGAQRSKARELAGGEAHGQLRAVVRECGAAANRFASQQGSRSWADAGNARHAEMASSMLFYVLWASAAACKARPARLWPVTHPEIGLEHGVPAEEQCVACSARPRHGADCGPAAQPEEEVRSFGC